MKGSTPATIYQSAALDSTGLELKLPPDSVHGLDRRTQGSGLSVQARHPHRAIAFEASKTIEPDHAGRDRIKIELRAGQGKVRHSYFIPCSSPT